MELTQVPTTPSSKPKRSYQEILDSAKFNPETIKFKPDRKAVEKLMRRHGFFDFNIELVMADLLERDLDDILDVEGYIKNMAYYASRECKHCYNQGCRICLGIDL